MTTSSPEQKRKVPPAAKPATAPTKRWVKTVEPSKMGQRVTPEMMKGALDF